MSYLKEIQLTPFLIWFPSSKDGAKVTGSAAGAFIIVGPSLCPKGYRSSVTIYLTKVQALKLCDCMHRSYSDHIKKWACETRGAISN